MEKELANKLRKAGFIGMPTLDRMIDQCGMKFYGLINYLDKGWVAEKRYKSAEKTRDINTFDYCKTPEEAVARLWLRLHDEG